MNLGWWNQWQCRRGIHQDVFFSVGLNPYNKHCRHCKRPGILTVADVTELRRQWKIQNPGGDDEVPVESAEE